MTAIAGLAAREGALRLIGTVLDRGAMVDEGTVSGDAAIKAEARGLADLALRRLGQIDAILSQFVQRMPAGHAGNVLRLMTAELVFARTAPHAAVDLAVRLAKRGKNGGRIGGLVNAVGRRVAKKGAAIAEGQDAARLNMPDWLWTALAGDWGEDAARAIAGAHLTPAPHDLTLAVPADAEPLAREIGARVLPTGTVRLEGRAQISALPGYEAGAWWAQDAAAALPARMIPDPAGKRVLDLCAAPGGKTMQLAAAGAQVTALDRSDRRMKRLSQNLARTKLTAACVTADALTWAPEAPFDAILLDAPCSATGTIRRHPDLMRRRDRLDLAPLTDLQARMLNAAAKWLAPGGVLVFCTCSLLRAEGEDQADAFLDRHPAFARMAVGEEEIPSAFVTSDGDLRTRPDYWPDLGGLDGFFAARFSRQ
ncbi:MAG: methyltransferase domain-containing protein [Paracoccaceae bacterium]|nr:methyltransferase domain-containing protein [Paracoccaceae bacterium]